MQTFKQNFASEKEKSFIEKLKNQNCKSTTGALKQQEMYGDLLTPSAFEQSCMIERGQAITINICNTFQTGEHIIKNPDARILVNKANLQAICAGLLKMKENELHLQHSVVIYLGGNGEVAASAKEHIEKFLNRIGWTAQLPVFVTAYSCLDKTAIHFVSFFYDELQMRKQTALDIENKPHEWSHSNKNRSAADPREPHDDFHTFMQMTLRWLRSNRGLYFNLFLDCQCIKAIDRSIREYFGRYLPAKLFIEQQHMTDTLIDSIDCGDYVSIESVDSGSIEDYVLMQNGDPDSGIIAISSPLGRCLLGCQAGDEAQYSVMDKTHRIRILDVQKNYARKHNL